MHTYQLGQSRPFGHCNGVSFNIESSWWKQKVIGDNAAWANDLVRTRLRIPKRPSSDSGLYRVSQLVTDPLSMRTIESNIRPLRHGECCGVASRDSAVPGENCRVGHDIVSGDIGDAARQPVSNSGDSPARESSSQAAGEGIADESPHGVGARTRHVGVSRCPGPASRSGRRTDQHCGPQPMPSELGCPCGTGHFPRHTQHPGEGHLTVGGVPGGGPLDNGVHTGADEHGAEWLDPAGREDAASDEHRRAGDVVLVVRDLLADAVPAGVGVGVGLQFGVAQGLEAQRIGE